MKQVILHILCEGQTEEKFVKEVLSPYLRPYQIVPTVTIVQTSKTNRGGMLSYAQAKRDLTLLMKQNKNNDYESHLFTTMFDYYALPNDFPGYAKHQYIADVRLRLTAMERDFFEDISDSTFIPYIQLHEFEALLFTDIMTLSAYYPKSTKNISKLKDETDRYADPEMINNGTSTAPSKRIIKTLEKEYRYNKVQSGTAVTKDIGISAIIDQCQHFREWLYKIVNTSQKYQ